MARAAGLPRLTALVGAVLVSAVLLASPAHAKRVAFVVGINNYENLGPNQQLNKAVADARAIADTFTALGFQVIKAENSKRNAFFQSWQRFLNAVQPGDVTAVYFAGHGVELQSVNYLLASDIPDATDGADVLKGSAIDIPALIERLKEQQPQVSLVIIDACRDNPYLKRGTRSVGGNRGLGGSDPPKGTFQMMSAGKGESALDALSGTDANPNSVYTRKLIPLLREPGLEITDIALRIRSEVTELARTVGHEQSPAFYHQLTGKFFLTEPRATPVAVNTPRVSNATSEAAEAWAAVDQTRSVAVLQSFIRRYGDTFFGDLAKQRIDEINRGSAAAPPPSAPLSRPAPPEPQRDAPSLAEAAARGWDAVGRSNNTAELEDFARRFDRTIYSDLARARIAELRKLAVVTPAAPPSQVRQPPAAAPEPSTPPLPAPVATPAVRPPSSVFQAAQAWAAVKDSADLAILESFAKQHGETIYGPLANARIDQLKRITVASATPDPVRSSAPAAAPAAKPVSTLEAGQAWNNTKNSDNPAVIERFIKQYGDTIYGPPAQARLAELQGKPTPVPPPPPPVTPHVVISVPPGTPVSAFEAAQAWNNTKNSENPAVLERFIKQYGETIYGPPAKARLAELLRQPGTSAAPVPPASAVVVPPSAQPAATATEATQAWANTQRSENPTVLEHFIKQYGDSIHGPAARTRLEELRRKPGARTATADTDPVIAAPPFDVEAAQAWNNTKDSTSRVVVERFLKQYGDSIYAEPARAKLKQLN